MLLILVAEYPCAAKNVDAASITLERVAEPRWRRPSTSAVSAFTLSLC
jgi:hypothetical protein